MKNKVYIAIFVLLSVIYFGLVLLMPTDPLVLKKYHLTQSGARWLNLSVAVPLIIIWLSALYGFISFRSYAHAIKGSTEGRAFSELADGLMVLAFSLPITSLLSNILAYLVSHQEISLHNSTIIRNYAGMIFSVVTFVVLSKGAKNLLSTAKYREKPRFNIVRFNDLYLIILSSLFVWMILSRTLSQSSASVTYQLSDWQIILTLAIPYLFAWNQGVLSACRLYLYKNKVKGRVYKMAFNDMAKGIGVIVFVSIFVQFITTLTGRLNRLNLTPILILIYILLILYAVGYGLVARGAKKLNKIEEV